MRTILAVFGFLSVLIASAQTYPDRGGAQINQPFQEKLTGAVCFTGTGKLAGSVFLNFPTQDRKALSFTVGPAAEGQEKNDAFTGPGTYSNIGIFLRQPDGGHIFGYGEVMVNDDERSGSFSLKTASSDEDQESTASGTWDCGRKLSH